MLPSLSILSVRDNLIAYKQYVDLLVNIVIVPKHVSINNSLFCKDIKYL